MTISPATRSLLSAALALPEDDILAALQAIEQGAYEYWKIPKGDGRYRELAGPVAPLKQVQRAILDRLLNHASVSPFAHGFVTGRSIVSNARVHAATAQAMLSVDLKDAFPSVSKKRVREVIEWRLGPMCKFMGAKSVSDAVQQTAPKSTSRTDDGRFIAYAMQSAAPTGESYALPTRETLCELYDVLTTLCTDRDRLPQGAPTSGMLLNLACARMDRLVYRAVLQSGRLQMRYSRYADDLTISDSELLSDDFVAAIKKAVIASGFQINLGKIKRVSAKQRDLLICGIRLHQGELALPRASLKAYRALFHQALSYDADSIPLPMRQRIVGTLGLLRMVYACCPKPLVRPLQQLMQHHQAWLKSPRAESPAPFSLYSL